MCSFVFGCALAEPILGPYFELPKKNPPNLKLIYDENQRKITDVKTQTRVFVNNNNLLKFVVFTGVCISIYGYREICCEKNTNVQGLR